mmetsp:Transcript_4601/g.10378  ORF Transcript_4601/g.10378 Transcript_4601/m.10378 type:complete len:2557 (+) Transcript_4601:190-7860(+)|eukprot:CAMPEP_0172320484 /NCGR_PEP_ID=MMETSP1058-20130122/40651_1 /TAXON_ID=83371 /ORGANISM="Detonula confervacea, Strain CCMP 353" /LENGTH=2556 /DNA_ID=CAMNT_0013035763 /DNA_START=157 /DNA_END=7827 /DNA_ORIENTATION=+
MSQEASRTRRSRKKVDYSIEQQFSDDDDIFEDGPKEVPASSRKKSRPRKSTASGFNQLESGMSFEKSKPVYTERGYDSSLLPLRERFAFEPEYEDDGTPSLEVIVGRRPIDDARDRTVASVAADKGDGPAEGKSRTRTRKKGKKSPSKEEDEDGEGKSEMDYEYLIKYKGQSYLHLEWKTAADLESMNTKAKTMYRRFLKKLEAGTEEDLEDPTVDPSFTDVWRILAEEEHEIMVELSDKELVKWEKEQKKELEEMESDDAGEEKQEKEAEEKKEDKMEIDEKPKVEEAKEDEEPPVEVGEPGTMTIEDLRRIVSKEEPYYPSYPGSDNPYRDGYFTEPPRKPRPSYLFYQGIYRSYFGKNNPNTPLPEIMTMLGDSWRALSEEQQAPYIQLANEETASFEKEKALLERAQRPTEMWQPIRRCKAVLDRLCDDPFASIFLEPVDTNVFTDYLEVVDVPMDLATVREKLKSVKNYMGPEVFARDARKIWNNCKIYNQHGSQIWHVADYMSKLFERLYHAWILDFRDRYLRWNNPAARPWEMSCRSCNGDCKTPDSQMVLCDHCDAMYSINCLKPKLKKVPKGVWHCPACAPKIGKNRTVTILSAVTEQAAKKRADMGDIPKKQVKQKMFLVKWSGLGYEHCSWEKESDINDDAIIAEFRRLEGVTPEEPDMTGKEVQEVIQSAVAVTLENAGGSAEMASMRSQLHAQTRAFQFKKFGMDTPCLLGAECGPKEKVFSSAHVSDKQHPIDVVSCMEELVYNVATNNKSDSHSSLPPLMNGEYDVILPVTPAGLLLNVGEVSGCVAFLGYRQLPDGSQGPAEIKGLIRKHGDLIIAVNGKSCVGKSFKQIIPMLKESNTFSYVRLVHKECEVEGGFTTSCGSLGRFLYDDLSKTYKEERRRLLAKRSLALIKAEEEKDNESTSSEGSAVGSDNDSDSDDSASDIEPDSEDEALLRERQSGSDDSDDSQGNGEATPEDASRAENNARLEEGGSEEKKSTEISDLLDAPGLESVLYKQESTQHLAYGLLGLDVGYSSDEGGDEDVAYYIDGVDGAFTLANEVSSEPSSKIPTKGGTAEDADPDKDDVATLNKLPVKKTDFSIIGKKSQLQIAVALTSQEPDIDDFDNYPLPSAKQIAAEKQQAEEEAKKAEEEARELEEQKLKEAAAIEEAAKPKKKSTTKVEQISTLTSEVIRVWINAEDAASTMQLDLEAIQKLLKGKYDADFGDEVGGYRWRYADVDAVVTEKASSGRDSKKGREAYLEFREKLYDPKEPHIYKNENKLRDYQVDGVNWLSSTYYKHHGCILADEMGLGKTVQIVSYLEHLFRVEKIHGPFLVVVPLSTVEHWRREFEGWTNMQCCIYHDRQRVWRDVLREYEWYYEDRPHTPEYLKFNVLVTTYDTLIGDFDVIGDVPWRVSVVDEAHRLRNVKGKLLECMKEISAKGTLKYGYQSRVLMTGTPLQNNTAELWTLLNFIEPSRFRSLEEFEENFGNMANREQVEALQRKISPFMLRRVKEDVAKDIPAKEETVIDVELTSIQKQYYRAIFEHNHAFLSMGSAKSAAPKLMNIQMELRKCCNHPFLLDGVESRELEKRHEDLQLNGELDNKTPEEQHDILNEYGFVMTSGKMVLLDKLLPKLLVEGHKVLIFSQFVKMLDLISDYCEFRDFRYERLDGRVRGNERQKAIDRFETEEDSFVFLLSTRAGGVGINLTAADVCIIYDSDWNPQNDVQAQARCHRIGQTKDVRIYRLVTSRTFEQEMFDRASKKLGLEQAILGTFGQDNDDDKPTSKEMERLLKRGAYALLEDENDEMGKEFVAEDIESILEKRTRTRVVEGAKTASWLNKKGMNVTKSKFASESASAGINVDDPLFWQKVMPDFVTSEILLNKISEMEEAFEKPVKGRPKKGKKSGDNDAKGLSRGNQKKVNEYMSDLKGLMEDIFEQDRENTLPSSEKVSCQTLLLTISVKEKLFNESQRSTAKKLMQRLEGDRRRKCRTSNIGTSNIGAGAIADDDDVSTPSIRKELLIVSSKKKRRSRGPKQSKAADNEDDESDTEDEKEQTKKKSRNDSELLDQDGFKKHSDDEDDWSDVDEDIYKSGKKSISMKEAKRRREWGAGKDPLKLAAMPWPVFPRNDVSAVLASLLEAVIKIDKDTLGIFSVPVPKDEFPDYYELVKNPMDYGTMKEKLDREEYRSAQAMQKDFAQVNQNCLLFNSQDSEIVREAQRQTLMRPQLLKEAALKNFLFICDDGNVIHVHDDAADKGKKGKKDSSPKKATGKLVACGKCEGCKRKACKKCDKCMGKKRCAQRTCTNTWRVEAKDDKKSSNKRGTPKKGTADNNLNDGAEVRKPRIRLRLSSAKSAAAESSAGSEKKQVRKRKATPQKTENGNARKKSRRSNAKASPSSSSSDGSDEEEEEEEMFDVDTLQSEYDKLDGTWEAARVFSTKCGPWRLPAEIESKFKDVATITLSNISKADEYDIFKEPVSESDVPGYHETITNPMDFGTMKSKLEQGKYGEGSDAAAKFYKDFLLVFDNCYTFNDGGGEVVDEAKVALKLMSLTFAKCCLEVMRLK